MTVAVFTCPFCGTSSRHPDDVAERYCAVCSVFVDDVGKAAEAWARGELSTESLERLNAGTGFSTPQIVERALGHG